MSFTSALPTPQILLKSTVPYRADRAKGYDTTVSLIALAVATDSASGFELAELETYLYLLAIDVALGSDTLVELVIPAYITAFDAASAVDRLFALAVPLSAADSVRLRELLATARAALTGADSASALDRAVEYGILPPAVLPPALPPVPPPFPLPPVASGIEGQKWSMLMDTIGDLAPDITQRRMIAISDVLNFDLFWNNLIRLLAGLLTVTDFGVGLTDFDLFYANFRIRLPTLEELLAGFYIVIEPISLEWDFSDYVQFDLGQYFDPNWTLDFPTTLAWFFKSWDQPELGLPYLEDKIARFDVTRYGEGVYYEGALDVTLGANPPLSAAQASALLPLTSYLSVTPWVVEQYAAMLGNYQLGKAVAMRIDFLEKVLKDAFFLGFNMLGYTPLRAREERNGVEGVTVRITVDGKDVGIFVNTLDRITFGFILGVTPLGLGRFTAEKMYTVFRNTAARYAWWRAMRQKEAFVSAASRLVHTVPLEETTSIAKSPRILTYGVHRHAYEEIRGMVARVVGETDPITLNKYALATIEAAYKNRIVHKRSRKWKARMDDESFKRIWLEKWTTMGLNRHVLEELYERARLWRKVLEREKREKPPAL